MDWIKRFRIWWAAWFDGAWYWRVTYPNGENTRKLSYSEASSLKQIYGGKLWIDYQNQ